VSGPTPPPYLSDPSSPLFLGARVDMGNQVVELREDNNTRVTSRLVLGSGPDLVVRSVTAPTGLTRNSAFTAQVQLCNEGNVGVYGYAPLELIISTETSLYVPGQGQPPYTQVQVPVGGVTVSSLAVGQCTLLPVQGFVMPPASARPGQPLYLGALVDAPNSLPELLEDNNALTMASPISQVP
ncbi:CARDB domain-containing protein, partial [Corallococcus aberystwythensis]